MKRGKLIVFEGMSGTGKETQAKLLQQFLKSKKIISTIIFHPSTNIKPILRKQKTVADELKVLTDDRKSNVRNSILPALSRGEWVISLRNYISAYVYQGDGSMVKKVDTPADIVFYFDIDPNESMKRIIGRGEVRGKYETIVLLNQKRKLYKQVMSTIPHRTIDASKSIQTIHSAIVEYIHKLIH